MMLLTHFFAHVYLLNLDNCFIPAAAIQLNCHVLISSSRTQSVLTCAKFKILSNNVNFLSLTPSPQNLGERCTVFSLVPLTFFSHVELVLFFSVNLVVRAPSAQSLASLILPQHFPEWTHFFHSFCFIGDSFHYAQHWFSFKSNCLWKLFCHILKVRKLQRPQYTNKPFSFHTILH